MRPVFVLRAEAVLAQLLVQPVQTLSHSCADLLVYCIKTFTFEPQLNSMAPPRGCGCSSSTPAFYDQESSQWAVKTCDHNRRHRLCSNTKRPISVGHMLLYIKRRSTKLLSHRLYLILTFTQVQPCFAPPLTQEKLT